jgi:hypothetical protein
VSRSSINANRVKLAISLASGPMKRACCASMIFLRRGRPFLVLHGAVQSEHAFRYATFRHHSRSRDCTAVFHRGTRPPNINAHRPRQSTQSCRQRFGSQGNRRYQHSNRHRSRTVCKREVYSPASGCSAHISDFGRSVYTPNHAVLTRETVPLSRPLDFDPQRHATRMKNECRVCILATT